MKKGDIYYPNIDDWNENFWRCKYNVTLTAQGIKFKVNADNASEALDYVIDYCEEHLTGLIMSLATETELHNDRTLEDYICGGNHGRYLNTYNVFIDKIRG